jgi:hypothetical protein
VNTSPNSGERLLPLGKLDWASAIGLFIINFGTLDYLVSCFLEAHLSPDEFERMKARHFKERSECVRTLVLASDYSPEQRPGFQQFFERLEPLRELRNHIAHGCMHWHVSDGLHTHTLTLSLPRDLDAAGDPQARQVTLAEMQTALSQLTDAIETFRRLAEPSPA